MDKKFIIKLLVFILMFIITPNVYASSANVYVAGYENYALVQEEINLINAERAKEGLEPLMLDEVLTNKAMIRAHEIAVSYSHTRPNGVSNFSILDDVSFTAGGENIAAGQGSPSDVMNAWMNSYDHMKNIMAKSSPASRFKAVGLGHFQVNGYNYWVQLFSDYVSSPLTRYDTSYYEGYIYVSFPSGERFNGFLDKYFNKNIDLNKDNTYSIFDSDPRVLYNYDCFPISKSNFTYWSDNNDIASVNGEGVITGISSGTTIIHAMFNEVDYTITVNVIGNKTVNNNIVIEKETINVIDNNNSIVNNDNESIIEEVEDNTIEDIINTTNELNNTMMFNSKINDNHVVDTFIINNNYYVSDDEIIIIDENDDYVLFKTRGYLLIFAIDFVKKYLL